MNSILKVTLLFLLGFLVQNVDAQKMATKKTVKSANAKTQVKPAVQMTFVQEKIALGKMKKGSKKTFDYVFTNTGTDVIEIEIVSGCDCTTLDWTRGPIKPGGQGTINVIFDSKEKELTETNVDVDVYLKNKDKKTGSQILKVLNYTFELFK